jgi:hypothetical protein
MDETMYTNQYAYQGYYPNSLIKRQTKYAFVIVDTKKDKNHNYNTSEKQRH